MLRNRKYEFTLFTRVFNMIQVLFFIVNRCGQASPYWMLATLLGGYPNVESHVPPTVLVLGRV